ncbi:MULTISPECIES: hypothetical protein [Bradyrhizobium]|uniref:hypothetical protein n=1 Tax=Bradyrhizobium TaxID=374 RepID=UPI000841F141|nr:MULTISPECIES: hypothetical protein [Bradyrhizobium]ODM73113.1 hypothetical protein A6X20_38800 [Bradyrhizobium elkanii]ODM76865.1 hypothetical protein A6452_01520 [Bradyrhizobium elkanii]
MLKITGLDKLKKELDDAQKAFKALDGQVATVGFDPEKPESVRAAIKTMENAIDSKVRPYRDNALVVNIVPQLKEKYRKAILERARNAQRAKATTGK